MRKILIIFSILVLIAGGCRQVVKENQNQVFDRTNPIEKEEQNHLFLNLVLDRWEDLSNAKLEWSDTVIDLKEITLLKCKCDFDTTMYGAEGFRFPISPYGFYVDGIKREDFVEQTKSAVENWNDKFVHSTLRMDSCLKEREIMIPNELHNKNSFLVVSEPIEFQEGLFWVFTRLYTEKYKLNIMYITKKVNNKWAIVDVDVAVLRFAISVQIFDKSDNPEDSIYVVEERKIYAIFDGYME